MTTENWKVLGENWFDDPDEVLAFAKYYWDVGTVRTTEILYYFEKPWKWTPEYEEWKKDEAADKLAEEEEAFRDRNVMRDGTPYQI